jgi:hypothetical protein
MLIAMVRLAGNRKPLAVKGIMQGYRQERDADCEYAEGLHPPRYPVPAIRYEVEQDLDMVTIWNMTHYAQPKELPHG